MFKVGNKIRVKKSAHHLWASWCHDCNIKIIDEFDHNFTLQFTGLKRSKHYEGHTSSYSVLRINNEFELAGPPEFTVRVEFKSTDVDEATALATKIATAVAQPVSVIHV